MGNSSPLRAAIRNEDITDLEAQLKAAGEGAPDLINEDYTADCLCERTRNIQSPLHTCVAKRRPEMVELLLLYGADVTSGGRGGMTALHYAAKNGDVATCRLLVKHGADPGVEDHGGQVPVHLAAASCWAEGSGSADHVLRYLLEEVGKPGIVNHTDLYASTPLHVAAYWGYLKLARYLVENGADRDARNKRGRTPLDEAAAQNRQAVVQLLTVTEGKGEGQGAGEEEGGKVEVTEGKEEVTNSTDAGERSPGEEKEDAADVRDLEK